CAPGLARAFLFRIPPKEEFPIKQKIADIGEACGFGDTSYFVQAFRDAKGVTPRVWRMEKSAKVTWR
ncbi:MAG: AraC family transcriptional regulator, partial [Eubacterium sp.]|nr:AraC family transcriptional regulator [Eubacterium sp.]